MPWWVQVILQVVEIVIENLTKNPPPPDADQSKHDEHAAALAKVQQVKDIMNA